ncbi:MAG: hypothetical protein RR051_06940, partial [Clostridiales bacterium]
MNHSEDEYEVGLVGAMFSHYDACQRLRGVLNPGDFIGSSNASIFQDYIVSEGQEDFWDKLQQHGSLLYANNASDSVWAIESCIDHCLDKIKASVKRRRIATSLELISSRVDDTVLDELEILVERERSNDITDIKDLPRQQAEQAI